jgi:hypothetical protein
MEQTILTLKPDVVFAERDGAVWLTRRSLTRVAKDLEQARMLRALHAGSQTPESLALLLQSRDEAAAALTLAAFILDFEEYLES